MEVEREADLCEFQSDCKERFMKVLDRGSACVLKADWWPSVEIRRLPPGVSDLFVNADIGLLSPEIDRTNDMLQDGVTEVTGCF